MTELVCPKCGSVLGCQGERTSRFACVKCGFSGLRYNFVIGVENG